MDKILSLKEAAALVGVDVRTMARYIQGRLIPFVRIGRHVLFSFNRLCQWLSESSEAEQQGVDGETEGQHSEPDEAEERFRQKFVDRARSARIVERSDEQRRLLKRLFELADKESGTLDEMDERMDIEERLEALAAEAQTDENEERAEFLEFFKGIPEPESKRVYELLSGWRKRRLI